MEISTQIFWSLILSIVVASIAWTVTQEEIFSEPREFAEKRSKTAKNIFARKFFYVFTCEYCFSFWASLFTIILTGFKLLFADWRGYVLSYFVLPWLANQWMSLYRRLRVGTKHESALANIARIEEKEVKKEAAE